MSSIPLAPRNLRRALILCVVTLGVGLASVLRLTYAEINGYRARVGAGEFAKPGVNQPGTDEHDSFTTLLIAAGALCIASVVAVARLTSHSIAQPLAHLVDIAGDVTHGRARRRTSPEQAGGLRELAEAFNRMLDAQQQAEERFRAAHDSLELKVSARTAELFRANKALKDEIEQRERVEKEFYQAQKMDALGKLAGGIAHDFNNLLTVIIGGAESVQRQLGPNHATTSLLQTVQQAAERAAGLTRPLLTFSRNQVLTVEQVHLNEAVEESARMLHRLLGVNVDLRLDLARDLPSLRTNPNQLQQVLVNLGVNARDAMEGIGNLYITTRLAQRPAAAPPAPNEPERPWVELVVRDTGCGMDAATKARIFEPFFTTKPLGQGTGLGLSVSLGLIQQHGGTIIAENCDPRDGTGARFTVRLPSSAHPTPTSPEQLEPALAPRGLKRVLVIDDEVTIRRALARFFGRRGWSVTEAEDGLHAADRLISAGESFDLVVSDIKMPRLSGIELHAALRDARPEVLDRLLFCTGDAESPAVATFVTQTACPVLLKPFDLGVLASVSDDIVARAGPLDALTAT
jgi:signal transduction histidine kinase/ActR/RegA family two-component response regulator